MLKCLLNLCIKYHSPPLRDPSWSTNNPLALYTLGHRKSDLFLWYATASSWFPFNAARELTSFFMPVRAFMCLSRTCVLYYILTFGVMTRQLYASPVTYIELSHLTTFCIRFGDDLMQRIGRILQNCWITLD